MHRPQSAKLSVGCSSRLALALLVTVAATAPASAGVALAPQSVAPKLQPALSPPATPAADARLADLTRAADYSAAKSGRAMLVMQHGKVIFERYDNGWTASRPHPLASGTKSFTGVTAAIAIADGLISGWDELVCDTITEWKNDPDKKFITVRHLLSLSSGLDPADDTLGGGATPQRSGQRIMGPGTGSRKDQERGSKAVPDKFKAAVTTKSVAHPGQRFEYGPSHYMAFGEFLQRKLTASTTLPPAQKSVLGYMQARLFDPIGLDVAYFGKDLAGNPNLPGGCFLTSRQWATFGQLVLQSGAWTNADGSRNQVVRPDLLAECFKPSKTNSAYGLTWWLLRDSAQAGAIADGGVQPQPAHTSAPPATEPAKPASADDLRARLRNQLLSREASVPIKRPDGKPWDIFMAAGLGKQRLYVMPQDDMVIVRFAENNREGTTFENAEFLSLCLGLSKPHP